MSQIREIKEATDILEVIGSKVALQRSGTNWRGLCPFHNEKTPSFFVSEEMQRYKCFGCGRTGDVYTFLQEYEGMTFYEALEFLADKAGIKLESSAPSSEDLLRSQVLQALDLAKEYYHFLLVKHKVGTKARAYLEARGVTAASIKLFQLGAAPNAWDGIIKYLHQKKNFSLETLEKAGLVIKGRTGRYYDRFRQRVIFPLRNHRGQVVGFSGRLISQTGTSQDEKEAKYINSPETLVYHKSELLYGLSELKQPIREKKQVIVVEGEFDVISSEQAHVSHVTAIKGSALTKQHVKVLSRNVEQVLLCLDADSAGVAATKKAIAVINQAAESVGELELRVIKLPKGKDPDDLARSDPKQWRQLSKTSVTAYEFLIDAAFDQFDANQPSGKKKIMAQLTGLIAGITHAVEREYYIQELSRRLEVSTSSVQADLDEYSRLQGTREKMGLKNRSNLTDGMKAGGDASPSGGSNASLQRATSRSEDSKKQSLEKYLWFLLFHADPPALHQRAEEMTSLRLEQVGSTQILQAINNTLAEVPLSEIVKELPDDLQEIVFELHSSQFLLKGAEQVDLDKEWWKTFKQLQQLDTSDLIRKIEVALEKLDNIENKSEAQIAEQEELLRKLVQFKR